MSGTATPPPARRLVRNAARCLRCGETAESREPDEVGSCACGSIHVSGGLVDPQVSWDARPGGGWEDESVELTVLEGGAEGGAAEGDPAGDA